MLNVHHSYIVEYKKKPSKSLHCCDNHALWSIAQIWPPDCEQLSAVYIPTRSQSPSLLRYSTALYSPLIPVSTDYLCF